MTPVKYRIAILLSAVLLVGCSSKLIGTTPGADQVAVANPDAVGICKPLGRTSVSVYASSGPFTRSAEAIEANLEQLARNEVVKQGGDTIVKGDSTQLGQRFYDMYKCK